MNYLIPNIFTALGLLSGISALVFGGWRKITLACTFIFLAAFFDGFDGQMARWLGAESRFGHAFDSYSDFVSFGLAPAALFLSIVWPHRNFLFVLTSILYVIGAAYRLMRFHRNSKDIELAPKGYFRGLPTTGSAIFLAALVVANRPQFNHINLYVLCVLFLTFLMVSNIPYPHFRRLRNLISPWEWMIILFWILFCVVLKKSPYILVGMMSLYLLRGLTSFLLSLTK